MASVSAKELKTKCCILRNHSSTPLKDSSGAGGGMIIFKARKLGHKLESEFVSFWREWPRKSSARKLVVSLKNNLISGGKMNRKLHCSESWLKGELQNHSTLQGNAFSVAPWSQLMDWKRTGQSGHQRKPDDGQLRLNPCQAQSIQDGEACVKMYRRHREPRKQQLTCLCLSPGEKWTEKWTEE